MTQVNATRSACRSVSRRTAHESVTEMRPAAIMLGLTLLVGASACGIDETPTTTPLPAMTPARSLPPSPPSRGPATVTPVHTPSVDGKDFPEDDGNPPPYEEGDDDALRPTTWDLSELSDCGMSPSQVRTVESNLDSVLAGWNSEEPNKDKRVASYRVSDVARREVEGGGWVYSARLITNVGDHELRITTREGSSGWGARITIDDVETL